MRKPDETEDSRAFILFSIPIHHVLSKVILQRTQQNKYLQLEIYIRLGIQLWGMNIKEFDLVTDAIIDGYRR